MKKILTKLIFVAFIAVFIICCFVQAPITQASGSLWSLLPPIVAIGLALITKEVYSSLFIGIVTGGLLHALSAGSGFAGFFTTVVSEGIIANISDTYNVGTRALQLFCSAF